MPRDPEDSSIEILGRENIQIFMNTSRKINEIHLKIVGCEELDDIFRIFAQNPRELC